MRKSKSQNIPLSFDGKNVRFSSEKDLEDYVEQNFHLIFPDLTLLARQYTILERRCDLICCKKANSQGIVIELKNQEDRYVVTQLTRYHRSLLISKPFDTLINYSLPIELIAISPSFHSDNYIDKEYSKLEFQTHFYKFDIEYSDTQASFKILDRCFKLNYPILGLVDSNEAQPIDKDFLFSKPGQFYQTLELECRQEFLKLHHRLTSQASIKCWTSNNNRCILYGTGSGKNHQKLAEINNGGQNLYLYLWLPTAVKTNVKIPIARFGLVCKEGSKAMHLKSEVEWVVCSDSNISIKDRPSRENDNFSYNRQGMRKWCSAKNYLHHASQTSYNHNTFNLFMYLLRDVKRPFLDEDISWWEQNNSSTPTNLGWYLDLAIKTWQYRRSR
jgi:hypothetical protein